MIKVEIYKFVFQWENEEPEKVLTLKEFEEVFNDHFNNFFDIYRIRFVVA